MKIFKRWLMLTALVSMILSGCGSPVQETSPPLESGTQATATLVPEPTQTPTPLVPVGALLAPLELDPQHKEELVPLIVEGIKAEGLRYQERQTLSREDFQQDEYRMVVILPPYPEVEQLAAAAPETKFLAVGFSELEPAGNLSVIRPGQNNYGVQGFIAGYMAAMITTDWRVGALSLAENENALAAREGFVVGAKYFCGLCNPKYAPTGVNYLYPKFIDLPPDASDLDKTANVNFMVDRAVETFYVAPGAGDDLIYDLLVSRDVRIIGSGEDFQEAYQDHWVASLEFDLVQAFEDFWPEFLSQETGVEYVPPLQITDVNPDLLSQGKLDAVHRIQEEVSEGLISTTQD